MKDINFDFANSLLFSDPETGEELRLFKDPEDIEGSGLSLFVESKDGKRRWKHTIKTEEL